MNILIADSGSTKCEWCLLQGGKKKRVDTQGISPYFLDSAGIGQVLQRELLPALKEVRVDEIFYYGTGCNNPDNRKIVQKAIRLAFPVARVHVTHDLMGAALALCGSSKGICCILGTGSNSCYFDGRKIAKNSPGLGFILGDEGSGAYLGKKVLQYYLYNTFDEDLRYKFDAKYATNSKEILESVYKQPLPNRYLASYTLFLAENRGHYMIENIIEDGLNDFFFNHLCKYRESWKLPIHFVGGVASGFRDVIRDLCNSYEFELGKILQKPMEGLIKYHQ
ncbi:MAG TPA: BadF/BadG/BcrA/BcrD ATPase family protein [Puia sp.]|jgi:glucosamine kinase|nr:BadF/BadG/BcrA/BcrD ATPase family protein [Puia sp.]